jgi:CRISPR-associated endonuclease/helicase Cas3
MSLDLSATLLVTDLAPIPAMIQRLGRLNRRARSVSDPIQAFIVIEPIGDDGKMLPLPYTNEKLTDAKEWISKLPSTISQKDLVSAWESMNSEDKNAIDSSSCWIDGGFERNVKEIRDATPSINVVRTADVDDVIQGRRSILEVAIPMNQRNGITTGGRTLFQGAMIVEETELWYSETLGAEWR